VDLGAGNDHPEPTPEPVSRDALLNVVAQAIRDVNIAEHLEMMLLTARYRMAEAVLDRLLPLIPDGEPRVRHDT
jgi:hypothetical protein